MQEHEVVLDLKNKIMSIDGVNLFDCTEACQIYCHKGINEITVKFMSDNVKFQGEVNRGDKV